jgi:long-chain fatty acid transport protein
MLKVDWRAAARAAGATVTVWTAMAAFSTEARAAGFATQKFGGEEGGPMATNPTALYYNPAGIALSDGWHLYFDEQVAMRYVSYQHSLGKNDFDTYASGEGNTGTAKLFNVFEGPALGLTAKFGDLALGVGAFVPFGGRETWAKNPSAAGDTADPFAVNGVQRWSSDVGSLTFLYLTGGAAYKLGPLSIGVTGNFIESWVQFTRSQNETNQQIPNNQYEQQASLDVKGANGSFGAGAMLEIVPKTLFLGASYQSQPGMGNQTLKGQFNLSVPAGSQGTPTVKNVTLTEQLPDVFRGGIRLHTGKSFELRVFGDYTRWSKMTSQCVALAGHPCLVYPSGADATGGYVLSNIVRNWKDTWGARAGISIWPSEAVEVLIGGGYETGATPNAYLDPSIADANNFQGALGVKLTVAHNTWLYASYTQLIYETRNTTGQSEAPLLAPPSQGVDTGGIYQQWVGFFDVSVEKQF